VVGNHIQGPAAAASFQSIVKDIQTLANEELKEDQVMREEYAHAVNHHESEIL
jgi:hypothetical protein